MVNLKSSLDSEYVFSNPRIASKNNFDLLTVSSFPMESQTFIERYPLFQGKVTVDQIIRERWYPSRSDLRIKNMVKVFTSRFLVFDKAFRFLKLNINLFQNNDWKWILLIHLILTDPLFRWFTCEFLPSIPNGFDFSKDQVSRDIQPHIGEHVRATTRITYSAKLITAMKSLSLVVGSKKYTKVNLEFSSFGFYYFLFLLKSIEFDIDKLHLTKFYLALFESKDALFVSYDRLASQGYISVTWYGDNPTIQLKQVEGVLYV
jgi:hypothetical protein